MSRMAVLLVALALCGAALYAGDSPVTGKWDCRSVDERGTTVSWVLAVNQAAGGKLSATLAGDMGEIVLVDPKLDGEMFTFAIPLGPEKVDVKLKVSRDTLDGTFQGASAGTGTFKGVRNRGD